MQGAGSKTNRKLSQVSRCYLSVINPKPYFTGLFWLYLFTASALHSVVKG